MSKMMVLVAVVIGELLCAAERAVCLQYVNRVYAFTRVPGRERNGECCVGSQQGLVSHAADSATWWYRERLL